MKYVEQLLLGFHDGEPYIKNIYQFYSVKQKTKLRYKKGRSTLCGFKYDIIMPPLKQCKKDRFIRVCEKKMNNGIL